MAAVAGGINLNEQLNALEGIKLSEEPNYRRLHYFMHFKSEFAKEVVASSMYTNLTHFTI